MKKTLLLIFSTVFTWNAFPQEISGEWYGALKIQGMELPLVFHISTTENGYSSKLDSPQQGAFGIPMTSTVFKNDSLFISSQMGISYQALFSEENGFIGEFNQNGLSLPLKLTQEKPEAVKTPKISEGPKPYHSEEIRFENKEAEITLAGTLAFPKGKEKYPAVVLISGSGAQTRKGHESFLALSDFLTRNGIAVLHFDDRGVGESEGNIFTATSADFATDVAAAVDYLRTRKEIDKNEIGLIGHSEGGMIAPMVTSKSDKLAFLVLMAGPGIPGDELLLLQSKLIGKAHGMSEAQLKVAETINRAIYSIIVNSPMDSLKTNLTTYLKGISPNVPDAQLQAQVRMLSYPWMKFFLKYDPALALQRTDVPVLAINGENDLQVPAKINLDAIETALKKGGNKNATVKMLPGLNHLFQESETGLPSEYGKLAPVFSPQATELILNWIREQTN